MLEVTLDTVLLVVLLIRPFIQHPTKLVNRIVEFAVQVSAFDGKKFADEAHTIEPGSEFVQSRHLVID